MNGVIGNVWGMGKNFKVCRYAFLIYLKVPSKSVPEVSIIHFWQIGWLVPCVWKVAIQSKSGEPYD